MKKAKTPVRRAGFQRRTHWYKDAVIYQLHIKSFFDASGDGTGDLRGVMEKLDYVRDLGVTAIWLLPFYPSPLRDDGYDTADYKDVHPTYGNLNDFRALLEEAHKRGLYVITELVINHTSDQHPWFQKARRAPAGSPERDFYVWSDSQNRYADARIIFQDFEMSNWSWDPLAKAYYWHRFYSHQPDLNFENPKVHAAVIDALDFWLGMGVDGLRLDAIPYLYEKEGTNCENLPETHGFLKKLRAHVDKKYDHRMLLAEANQWPEDSAAYFGGGAGDECHMAFHFPLMPRLYMAAEMEDRFPIVDILEQTPDIPENAQWAIFLRNHDELTLEMVTDEERDYMYRVYARDRRARINLGIRRRLAPLMGNNRRKIELMHMLLFSLPGTPVLYYGDEIGMGDNYWLGDRNGVRTPMQWSPDRNAGFSRVNSQQLYLPVIIDPEYHYEAVNVENQERNPSSLLWWVRQRLALRGRLKSFGRGTIEFLQSDNSKILCFLRRHEDEVLMVAANLSHAPQAATVDLGAFAGATPFELLGQTSFPDVKPGEPYLLMLGGYDVYWLRLRKAGAGESGETAWSPLPDLPAVKTVKDVLERPVVGKLCDQVLPNYLASARWFRSKSREISSVAVETSTSLPVQGKKEAVFLCVLQVRFTEGDPERYVVPLGFAPVERAGEIPAAGSLARLSVGGQLGLLCDANHLPEYRRGLLRTILLGMRLPLGKGHLQGIAGPPPEDGSGTGLDFATLDSHVLNAEQSNTSLIYPDGYFLKTFRRLDDGMNPDPEITRFLTEHTSFRNSPAFRGTLEWHRPEQEPVTVCFAQGMVRADRDAWALTLESLAKYFETLVTHHRFEQEKPDFPSTLSPLDFAQLSDFQQELVGAYGEFAHLLGTRTAELHQALASNREEAAFVPEPYSTLYQRSVYQSIRTLSKRNLALLKKTLPNLANGVAERAQDLLGREEQILSAIGRLLPHKIEVDKIRIHGDYHLGQVLFTGKDFIILDFEGEPARASSERRLKRCALRDVAGMIRSFHYAAHVGLRAYAEGHGRSVEALLPWAEGWYRTVAAIFLKAYVDRAGGSDFIPESQVDFHVLLEVFLLEKAVYELGYELNNRPDWVAIPLEGILSLLGEEE